MIAACICPYLFPPPLTPLTYPAGLAYTVSRSIVVFNFEDHEYWNYIMTGSHELNPSFMAINKDDLVIPVNSPLIPLPLKLGSWFGKETHSSHYS